MKKNLFLFISSLIVVFVIIEILLSLFYPQNLNGWYKTRDSSGLNILRKNSYFFHRSYGRTVKYTFGEYNNRITFKQKNDSKILILGDSFTFGWLVKDKNTFTSILQKSLTNSEIINPSVPGWGTADYTRYLENYCESIKPEKTIIMLNTDDFRRAYKTKLYSADIKNLIKIRENSFPEIDKAFGMDYLNMLKKFKFKVGKDKPLVLDSKFHKIPFYKYLIKNSNLFYLLRQAIVNIKNKNFYNDKFISEKFDIPSKSIPHNYKLANIFGKILFIRLREIAKKCETDLRVVYSGWYNYKKLPNLYNPTIYFLHEASNFFKTHKIKYYDLSSRMKSMHNNPKKYVITYDNHPNELGHKIIGENLLYLFDKEFVRK